MFKSLSKRNEILLGILIITTIVLYYGGLNLGLDRIGFIIFFPILFLLAIEKDKFYTLFKYAEIRVFLLFLLLSFTAVFNENIDIGDFNFAIFKILASFMAAYSAIALSSKGNLEFYFHVGFIICFVLICFFEYNSGNFNLYTFYAPTATRSDFMYNANYFSYMGLFANFSIFRLYLKYNNKWTRLGLLIIPFLGVAISFTTQSRSGFILIILVNAIFWFWINIKKYKSPIYALTRKVLLLIVAFVVAFQFVTLYSESNIKTRLASDKSDDDRSHLAAIGFETFVNNPFVGVGAGNFINFNRAKVFTHNTYLEALAEHGVLIGSFILLVFILPFIKSFRLFLTNKSNPEFKLNLLFFLVFLMFNNIYVFYKASNAMMFFFIMLAGHYKLLRKSNDK